MTDIDATYQRYADNINSDSGKSVRCPMSAVEYLLSTASWWPLLAMKRLQDRAHSTEAQEFQYFSSIQSD
jgi:hypothetical protein